MKKEINDLLTLHRSNKSLKINQAFELQARYTDKYGVNVELTKNDLAVLHLELVYTLAHDGLLFSSEKINARDYDGVVNEVCEKMESMYSKFAKQLVTHFRAGYLG